MNIKFLTLLFSYVLILLLMGCGTGDGSANSSNEEGENLEHYDLSFSSEYVRTNGSLIIKMNLENMSTESKNILFASGHQYDIVIYNEEGEQLYDFGEGMMFTQAIIEETVAASETLIFEEELNLTSIQMNSESPEEWTVKTKLNVYQVDDEVIEDAIYESEFLIVE